MPISTFFLGDYRMSSSTENEDEKNNQTSEVSAVEPSTAKNSNTAVAETPKGIQNSHISQLAREKVMVLSDIVSFTNKSLKTEDHEKFKQMLSIVSKLLKSNNLRTEEQEIIYKSLITIINYPFKNEPNLHKFLYNFEEHDPLTDILDDISFQIISINPTLVLKTVNPKLISLNSTLYENLKSYMRSILKYNEESKLTIKEIQTICLDLHTIRVNLAAEKDNDEDIETISKDINSVMTSLMSSLPFTKHIAYHADLVKSETLDPKIVAHMRLKAQSTRYRFYGNPSCVCYLMRPASVPGWLALEYITPNLNVNAPDGTLRCRQVNNQWEWYKGVNKLDETFNSFDDLLKAMLPGEATRYPVPSPDLF